MDRLRWLRQPAKSDSDKSYGRKEGPRPGTTDLRPRQKLDFQKKGPETDISDINIRADKRN